MTVDQFESERTFETVSRDFINVVEQHCYTESSTIEGISEGTWDIDLDLPLLPIRLEEAEFSVRAEMDPKDGFTRTPGRNYDVGFTGSNGFRTIISLNAPYEDRPKGSFVVYGPGDEAEEIELSEVDRIIGDIHQAEATGKLHKKRVQSQNSYQTSLTFKFFISSEVWYI
jgi:hypothetical protein